MEIQEVKKIQFVKIGTQRDWRYYDIDNHDFKFLIRLDEKYLLQAYDDDFMVLGNQSYAYVYCWKRECPFAVSKTPIYLKTLLAPFHGAMLTVISLPVDYKCKFLLLHGERIYQCLSYELVNDKLKVKLGNGKTLVAEYNWDTDLDTGERICSTLTVQQDDEI